MGRRSTRSVLVLTALCLAGLVLSAGAQASGASIQAWGYNFGGQVGNGTTTQTPPCTCIPTPTPVKGIANATQVSGGETGAVALLADGTVVAWGEGGGGALGNGGVVSSAVPVPVPGVTGAIAVASGFIHNLALLSDGTVMAWGSNTSGQLGIGDISGPESCGLGSCRKTAAPVPGLSNVIAISVGRNYDLALLADGTVMAWGYDYDGELGDGTGKRTGTCTCTPQPVQVPGVTGAVAISAAQDHATALLKDGTVVAWGFNASGQLGTGTPSKSPPECQCLGPVAAAGIAGVREISAGSSFSTALQGGGPLLAWGNNASGQLGNGTTTGSGCTAPVVCVPSPAAVAGAAGVRSIAAGYNHALALREDGTVLAWGKNGLGELGTGSNTPSTRPTAAPVPGLAGVSGLSEGTAQTPYALVGPSQTLNVAFAGAGAGTVGTDGLLCSSACAGKFPQSQVKALRADSTTGGFAGWSGPCSGTGACLARLDSDQTVTATFGVPAGTAITQALVKARKGKASFSFTASGAITGYQCRLIKPKSKKKGHKKHGKGRASAAKKKGGKQKPKKPPAFTACATPMTYKHLKPGAYKFEVRALDILGADAVPAAKKFTIKKAKKKKHHPKPKHPQQH